MKQKEGLFLKKGADDMENKDQAKLVEEMRKMEYEPILPVEKALVGWSIGIGIALLFLLYWVSKTFFPTGH